MSYYDSDDERPVVDPTPIDVNASNEQLYKHLTRLEDAETKKRKITGNTKLVALYDPTSADQVLQNFVSITKPEVMCKLQMEDGRLCPESVRGGKNSYYLYATYNKLLLAPVIRLECRFIDNQHSSETYHTLVLEFHFLNYNGEDSGIEDYKISRVGNTSDWKLSFKARGATCSGFNLTTKYKSASAIAGPAFTPDDKVIEDLLKSFVSKDERRDITLILYDSMLTQGEQNTLKGVRARLPGGDGLPLPSFGHEEYAAFGEGDFGWESVPVQRRTIPHPSKLLCGEVKHPMVPLTCDDAPSTVKEWAVQCSQAVLLQEAEHNESMRLWASTSHKGRMYSHNDSAVLAVRFDRDYPKLGTSKKQLPVKLPNELEVDIVLPVLERDPNGTIKKEPTKLHIKGFSIMNTLKLPLHDAFFLITSHSLKKFELMDLNIRRPDDKNGVEVRLAPHYNSFTTAGQLQTVHEMQKEDNKRWHKILLNQEHDSIPEVDFTKGIDETTLRTAEEWLLNFRPWNEEQLKVIKGIHKTKGGLSIILGPAGTGKSLLKRALACFFYKLGYHLVDVAPANTNVDGSARGADEDKQEDSNIEFLRMYPCSRDIGLENLTTSQAAKKTNGHVNGEVCSFDELRISLENREQRLNGAKEYSVEAAVLRAAREGELQRRVRLKNDRGREYGEPMDIWEKLREFFKVQLDKTYHLKSDDEKTQYKDAYRACKAHIVGRSRWILTTTGNVRATDIIEHFYAPDKEYGVPRKGVILFVDEAVKDIEINLFAPIVCEKWASKVKGAFWLGDDKQLMPTNTCATGEVQYNAFQGRLDISAPVRLVREGFPCHRLKEQRRMHHLLSAFPNKSFYNGILRDGPGTDRPLDAVLPGFTKVLKTIIARKIGNQNEKEAFLREATDSQVRLHWVEVEGERVQVDETRHTMTVHEHIRVFFADILPQLQEYFKKEKLKLQEHVMVICAYGGALQGYKQRISEGMRSDRRLTPDDMPRVVTVDASQGQEAPFVFLDASCQKNEDLGFMGKASRCNVAITRAKHCFWMIGGEMTSSSGHIFDLTRYKRECDDDGRTHKFK